MIKPTVVPVGKDNQVTLTFDHANKVSSVNLQPGGPFLKQHLSLDNSTHNNFQILRRHNGIYVRNSDNKVIAFFSAERASDGNGHYQFAAAAEHGIQVYLEHDWDQKSSIANYRTSMPALDISVTKELAYIATGNGGLTVLSITNIKQPQWLGSHQQLGRAIKISSEGRRVAVLNDAGHVFLLDTSNPAEPTTISTYRSKDPLLDIALHGDQLFALTNSDIQIIDFSAETPQLSNEGLDFGQGVNLGGERRVFIKNSIAYVADWFSGIHIYDLSRPRQPELLSSFNTPGSAKGIVVRDGIAFVADDDHGLQIIDVSDPVNPQQISTLLTNGLAYTPRIQGDRLYLASHRGGFQIIDISDVAQPTLISEFDTEGKAWSMEVHDNIAYVADDESGLLMFDVSNPANPELIGQYLTGGAAEEVIIHDNIAYVAFFDDGLHILDISNPRQPELISQLGIPGNARGLDLVNDRLYVAGWLSGIHIVDVKNAKQPKLLGSYDTRGAAWGVKAVDNILYVMDWWGGVSVIDINNPNLPKSVGGYHTRGQVNHIAAQGNYAFVAQGSNGIQVFDIRNPLNPTWTTGVSFPGQARQVAIQQQRAFVAAGDGGLAIVDISNPFNIRWLNSYDGPGETLAVTADADLIYLVNDHEGVVALSLKNDSVRRLTSLDIKANDLWLHDNHLYIATDQGISRVHVAKNGQFESIAQVNIEGGAQHITGNSQQLYISNGQTTVLTLQRDLKMAQIRKFMTDGKITDLQFANNQLFISTNHQLINIDMHNISKPQPAYRYPLLTNASNITYHQQVIYVSGEETITALQPMPNTLQSTQGKTEIQFALPNNLGIGSYNLDIHYDNGTYETVNNAIRIDMPKFSKPKISMDDFKKLLEEQKQTRNQSTNIEMN